jgi:hypothetical protein
MEEKPGWLYFLWKEPSLKFAIHEKSGWVYFEDGTKYSPQEIELLRKTGSQLTPELHRVKKVFNGEIIGVENDGTGRNDKDKPGESGLGKDTIDNLPPGPKIPETTGGGPAVKNGELEIY